MSVADVAQLRGGVRHVHQAREGRTRDAGHQGEEAACEDAAVAVDIDGPDLSVDAAWSRIENVECERRRQARDAVARRAVDRTEVAAEQNPAVGLQPHRQGCS